ncbi:peptide chain release factor H [Myroides sp. 1354]|uniref:peptide chain release factor H n=1 Tax=unclassified Myroides TaxID=2642485 RepID=UPI002575A85A|nr:MULTISPECIES: peptide chain release factor H [unclassified Myroides]MDM1045688.1 peptide chain release factor H [Myroides sp. R163-1]MDM1056690.1 peptide chain release factor H [Myroides sp. 1354]MDM1070650.1 peptide chain release factor H [Myroides sp. 1372]
MKKIIQITSGRGPAECGFAVGKIAAILHKEANKLQFTVCYQESKERDSDSIFIELNSTQEHKLESFMQSWLGSIQWICPSPFRSKHKRKNWFIGIFETTEMDTAFVLEENDLEYQAIRSSGAGGQHVNKVSSAVRVTHLPTGLQVIAMDSRSQHQNKKLAKERLLLKLEQSKVHDAALMEKRTWLNQTQIERGNPTRIFVGPLFKQKGSV